MPYNVQFRKQAQDDLARLAKNEPKAFKKAQTYIEELKDHPTWGLGHPEQLKGDLAGKWSRQITKKHRLVYEVNDNEVVVIVITAYGHYGDK
ncbi:MAG: Txe/YoeB family addiction module toxin [Muribaculaceae bacterium]|nr:Txe/YoeB family addiction module toxin [Muribaculaceae bacterium]